MIRYVKNYLRLLNQFIRKDFMQDKDETKDPDLNLQLSVFKTTQSHLPVPPSSCENYDLTGQPGKPVQPDLANEAAHLAVNGA